MNICKISFFLYFQEKTLLIWGCISLDGNNVRHPTLLVLPHEITIFFTMSYRAQAN